MFSLPAKLLFSFFSNVLALGAAVYFVPGFTITPPFTVDPVPLLTVAGIFALLNVLVRPLLKLLLGPLILLTFGLGLIVVNMAMLWLLDILSLHITIQGFTTLFFATIIIGLVNLLVGASAKRTYKS